MLGERIGSRLDRHHDLRTAGSGNPGAFNTASVLGARWGAAVLIADFPIDAAVAASAALTRIGR